MDLVEISPNANPPVCRVIEYSKYCYEQQKKIKQQQKKQQGGEVKEIRFRPRIGPHDFETKLNHIKAFLGERNKVKVTIQLWGRERQHKDLGQALLQKVKDQTAEVANIENENFYGIDGPIGMLLTPKSKVVV